jgi:hypothetical protein
MGKIEECGDCSKIEKKENFWNLVIDLKKKTWYTEQVRKDVGLFIEERFGMQTVI